jgi:hypothetical protein
MLKEHIRFNWFFFRNAHTHTHIHDMKILCFLTSKTCTIYIKVEIVDVCRGKMLNKDVEK